MKTSPLRRRVSFTSNKIAGLESNQAAVPLDRLVLYNQAMIRKSDFRKARFTAIINKIQT